MKNILKSAWGLVQENRRAYIVLNVTKGYLEGLERIGKLYLLVILTLAIAAIYEVLEVVILVNYLQ